MILLIAIATGLIATLLRAKLAGRQLQPIHLEFPWLVFIAVLPQLIVFEIPAVGQHVPDLLVSVTLVISQAVLLGFVGANLALPGMWVMALGLAANYLVIISNGGWMPIDPITVHRILPSLPYDYPLVGRRLGLSKDWVFASGDISFSRLADRFTTPGWIPYKVAFSIGDVLLAIGVILLLWSLSSSKNSEAI